MEKHIIGLASLGLVAILLSGCGGSGSNPSATRGGGSSSLDPVGNGEYDIETSCAQGTENCQSNFEAAEKAIKDHTFTNENLFTQEADLSEILANHEAITDDQENYLEFLFQHRKAEYILKEGITTNDGMYFRPGIYHRTNVEPPYENRFGNENFGAWLNDPIDGTAFVYVNTYFQPKAGYADYQPDTTQLANLDAAFEGKVKGYARVNSKPDDIDFEAGTFNADIKLQAEAGIVGIVGTVDNFRGTHLNSWDRFAFIWNPATGDLMPDGPYRFGNSPPEGTAGDNSPVLEDTSSLSFYGQTGQMEPAGIGGHLHMDLGDTGEAIGAFDAPKVPK